MRSPPEAWQRPTTPPQHCHWAPAAHGASCLPRRPPRSTPCPPQPLHTPCRSPHPTQAPAGCSPSPSTPSYTQASSPRPCTLLSVWQCWGLSSHVPHLRSHSCLRPAPLQTQMPSGLGRPAPPHRLVLSPGLAQRSRSVNVNCGN
ncbi:hypothetical protein HJG60_007746 [Phyllostomus discolor]|uniref:Uncharacterized protein n=1 Tax=Phyllostomus discolor TaxID=89673 RepID=A0A834BKF9_9CHIR|nr:hypothetical protein HJG60_007746 [Phyllostomus discolor]